VEGLKELTVTGPALAVGGCDGNHSPMRLISSARHSDAWPENDWCARHGTLYYTHHSIAG